MDRFFWRVGVLCLLVGISTQAAADGLGSFFSSLQGVIPGLQGQGSGGQSSNGFDDSLTGNYCRRLYSIAAISKDQEADESLISEEFKLDPKEFFDAFLAAESAKPGYRSSTFPSLNFYQGEFETDRINILYNLLLSYPSSQYMGALIGVARMRPGAPQYDNQARVDAIAALAMIHFRMQKYSRSPDRWKELVSSIAQEEHYTAHVIRARLLVSGEGGRSDATEAITLVREANALRRQYQTDGGYRTMSSRNYQVTSNRTLYEVLTANPRHPSRQYYNDFLQRYGQYQAMENGRTQLPELEAQLGPPLRQIQQKAQSARDTAATLLGGAKAVGRAKSQQASLANAQRNRVNDSLEVNMDTLAMAAMTRELEKIRNLDARQQSILDRARADAHASGDLAVQMMPTMMAATMNLMMQRGFEAMPAMLPYSKAYQRYSDYACTVVSRWDQALAVASVPAGQDAGQKVGIGSLMGSTGK